MPAALCCLILQGCGDNPPAATPGASILHWNGHTRATLPLAVDGNANPVTSVRIMGGDAQAVIDSGAGLSALEPDLASALGLGRHEPSRVNNRTFETTAGVQVVLGALGIELHKVVVGDLPGDTRAVLGMDLFRNAAVELDFAGRQLTLTHPDAFVAPGSGAIPLRMVGGVPALQVGINDSSRQVCAIVDTGFDGGVAVPRELVDELGLPEYPNRTSATEGLGGVRHVSTALVPLEQLLIGNRAYHDVPVVEWRSHAGSGCRTLLGMAILSRHRLLFDIAGHRMWLLPARDPQAPSGVP